jgi:hypothetical protein
VEEVTLSWTCPYCNQIATITDDDISASTHGFDLSNKEGVELWLDTDVVVCPNDKCRQYCIGAVLWKTEFVYGRTQKEATPLFSWTLRPKSKAKPLPDYIPKPITADYEEACLIVTDSPKASATLARRCLQGVIRDFWGISKARLIDEISELQGKIDPSTWEAIDAVRSIGNIGAHMEKDINLIVDVDPDEAELLIGLLEILFDDWYVARYERQEHMKKIVAVAQAKKSQQTSSAGAASKAKPGVTP